jgi:hypothetical protein
VAPAGGTGGLLDGSPESMRTWELEYGAEIGSAMTNFHGPIVLVVVPSYHGGAFVVFSNGLHEDMETAAVVGLYASVIGALERRLAAGAPHLAHSSPGGEPI